MARVVPVISQVKRLSVAALLAARTPAATAQPYSVTLITGDRVTVSARGTALDRGPGRDRMRFVDQTMDGDHYVIPVDALPLLRAGKLDRRLFDVTALHDFGYTSDK